MQKNSNTLKNQTKPANHEGYAGKNFLLAYQALAPISMKALLDKKKSLLVYFKNLAKQRSPKGNQKNINLEKLCNIFQSLGFRRGTREIRISKNSPEMFAALNFDDAGTIVWAAVVALYFDPTNESKFAALEQAFEGNNPQQEEIARAIRENNQTNLANQKIILEQQQAVDLEKNAMTLEQLRQRKIAQVEDAKNKRLADKTLVTWNKPLTDKKSATQDKHLANKKSLVKNIKALCASESLTFLQFREFAAQSPQFFKNRLTLPRLQKKFGLTAQNRKDIQSQALDAAKQTKLLREHNAETNAADQAKRARQKTFIFSSSMPKHLGITSVEYKRWLAEGRLKPSLMRKFTNWGKKLEVPLFDPDYLATITPALIATWRAIKDATIAENRSIGAGKARKTRALNAAASMMILSKDGNISAGPEVLSAKTCSNRIS